MCSLLCCWDFGHNWNLAWLLFVPFKQRKITYACQCCEVNLSDVICIFLKHMPHKPGFRRISAWYWVWIIFLHTWYILMALREGEPAYHSYCWTTLASEFIFICGIQLLIRWILLLFCQCLKFKTDQAQDAKKMEKLNNIFFTLMARGPDGIILF